MPTGKKLLAAMGTAAIATTALPVAAQIPAPEPRILQGSGVFTQSRTYMGPIVGYVVNDINSPFTFSIAYSVLYGATLPGTVQIVDPGLFPTASFSGPLTITMTNPNAYSVVLNGSNLLEGVTLGLDVDAPFPATPGPVSVRPTSTIDFAGRFFGYSGNITALSTAPAATAVPEAASWATMVAGLGAAGGALRRRRKAAIRVSFA